MSWQPRTGWSTRTTPVMPPTADTARVERSSPGLAAFFDGVEPDRSHSVLDLGAASGAGLDVYARYARWVRFVDLLDGTVPDSVLLAPGTYPANPQRPYDLVLAWDILDRLAPADRPGLIERLTAVTAPDARLFVVITGEDHPGQIYRFGVLDSDRMWYEPAGVAAAIHPPILPAEVQRLLSPFHVVRAFSSVAGLREYYAIRREELAGR